MSFTSPTHRLRAGLRTRAMIEDVGKLAEAVNPTVLSRGVLNKNHGLVRYVGRSHTIDKNLSKRWNGEFWGFRICIRWICTTGVCVVGFCALG